jgi:exodeoxyribonuclease V gamma subunit
VLGRLTCEHPLTALVDALVEGLDLLTATTPAEAWQITQARAELMDVAHTGDGRGAARLDLADVRGVLAERLAGRPTRANFRTGTLTVATLLPMRSVPHRVVCLLGLDDGVFPREGGEDGDDVLARDPRVGERDPRSEDRQMLLDALIAATEHLVVIHSGADERTNARREPAVPLGELLDVVGRGVVVRHPLQPFDDRDFTPTHPFSFDRAALAGAERAAGHRHAPAPFLDGPLAPVDEPLTALDDLVRFLEHPVKAFLSQRLGLFPPAESEEPDDALPVDLDGLQRWQIGDRLLADRLAGSDAEACRQAEWRRGALPPGALGDALLADIGGRVEALVAVGAPLLAGPSSSPDVDVPVDGGRVVGTVAEVRGDALVVVTYSTLAAKHRLQAWVRLLALTAHDPSRPWRAITVGRWGGRALRSTLGPVDAGLAREVLSDLVALRREGLRSPLPLITKASCAYAEARARGAEDDAAREKAAEEWSGRFPERDDPSYARVGWSGPIPGLDGGGFAELARRVWEPLLGAETKDRP